MRDILLSLVMLVGLGYALRRPDIGALLWAWVSTMNPHMLAYGFSRGIPWAAAVAAVTLLAFATTPSRRHGLPWSGGLALMIALFLWMSLTAVFSLNPADKVLDRWIFVAKIFLMLFITMWVLRGRTDIERLIWVVTLSIVFYGVKGGVWTVLTGGGGRVWGPPGGLIAGNNEIGVALVMVMPWMYYLFATAKQRWVRIALGGAMFFTAFGVLGTHSRGALLALLSMAFVLGLKGKRPWQSSIVLGLLVALAIAFMPENWTQRMDTIQGFREDGSAMSRLWTWQTMWNLAMDRPILGGGFRSDSAAVFSVYSPIEGRDLFSRDVFVAHSIYFQALGEHGFPGLLLFLGLGFWIWFAAARLARQTRDDPEFGHWVPLLMRMCQTALVGYAVGGAFLSLMNLDIAYYIPAVVMLTQATVKSARERAARQPAPVAGAGGVHPQTI